MRIIVNADDLGQDNMGNEYAFRLMSQGKVTSATLMANGPALEGAVEKIKYFPKISFGIHLNATEFKPLTTNKDLGVLLDVNGAFSGIERFSSVKKDLILLKAIYKEWCAQIEKLLSLGVKISHIDSHHHIHVTGSMFPIIKMVQMKYHIRKIRISKNIYIPASRSKTKIFLKGIYNFALGNIYKSQTARGFAGLDTFYKVFSKDGLNGKKFESVEVMVHPGRVDMNYGEENRILEIDWQKEIPFEITFISYNDL